MFGAIWLLFGLIYILLEAGLIGALDQYPTTGNLYSFKGSLLVVSIGSFCMGLFQGCVEVLWMKAYFSKLELWKKFVFKSIFYLILIILFLSIITLVTNAILLNSNVFSQEVFDRLLNFMSEFSFWTIIIYTGIILDIALFYSVIETYLGNNVVLNYLGKYHKPIQEKRIFMFLDMKSSTTIAEQIGHERYFKLLKTYYADMTNAILETSGEVYQYVGDEIVVTWKEKRGVHNNNCIHCFIKISNAITKNKDTYITEFGLIPEFKAGFHVGEVTAGEIGIIKKDLIYTGDILNTTARIQAECNSYNSKTLISESLFDQLTEEPGYSFIKIDELLLEGKKEHIQLYDVVYD
ncbi:adenylate/guanylate cyclase domain-containing protein [Psychroserpens jangbogonensis]|uniref:adenylate/guanylate cyclase domain-containing protein n=1 Tax=Psychroserpens jangbogonensis TaxID=1484460 RepID=UPI000AC704E5|nr:adenylate/guanylate cyclase domain-containing protein [Psychroserpens jangbogonensis]